MSWFRKLLPPKIKSSTNAAKKAVPEGLWSKCPACQATLYFTDLENNMHVCPKCSHHNRISARMRLDMFFDADGRSEIGSEVLPIDSLKFKDSKKYIDRLGGDAGYRGSRAAHGGVFRIQLSRRLNGLGRGRAFCARRRGVVR
jgi:acetyl-CoA carboxylase beta subunit